MTDPMSRRKFFKGAAIGAAALGVAASPRVLSGTADAAPATSQPAEPTSGASPDGAVTAFVRDHRTGEIAVMIGDREVVHHDRALTRRLARIAASAK